MPVSFSNDSPFWDLGAELADIEKEIRENGLKDIVIIRKGARGLRMIWRGTEPFTTALGMYGCLGESKAFGE